MGKKMEDWLRFSVCYWHSFCATGTEDALERFSLLFIFIFYHALNLGVSSRALLWGYLSHAGADPFGFPTLHRPWNEGTPMDAAKRRLQAAFEFFTKLGVRDISFRSGSYTVYCECLSHCALSVFFQVKYYTFHDR